jgi:hypothetical protein
MISADGSPHAIRLLERAPCRTAGHDKAPPHRHPEAGPFCSPQEAGQAAYKGRKAHAEPATTRAGSKQATGQVSTMTHELKAEHEFRAVSAWHIVPEGESRSLCGFPLAPSAGTRPITDLQRLPGACRPCEALYSGVRQREATRRTGLFQG